MNATIPQARPGVVTAEEGQVTLDGPDGVAVAMTPFAARETGLRLIAAADEAEGQTPGDADRTPSEEE